MNWLMAIPVIVFTAIAGVFLGGMYWSQGEELPSALIGQQAPDLDIVEIEGLPLLSDAMLRDGEVKIVNFWASWCAPCRIEHPILVDLAAEGVPIYGVNYDDLPFNARGFLDELGNPYTAVGADGNGMYSLNWGVYGVPETFLLDGDGTILLRMATPLTARELEGRLRPALDAALAAQ